MPELSFVRKNIYQQRIISALNDPLGLSLDALAVATGIDRKCLAYGGYLSTLRRLQLIHIGGWLRTESGGFQPVYRAGPGQELPRPKVRLFELDSAGIRLIERVLQTQGPMGYRELAEATGLACSTLKNGGYLDALLIQQRIYIECWERSSRGRMRAVYAAGNGHQAEQPTPFSAAEKSRRFRLKKLGATSRQDDWEQLSLLSFRQLILSSL